MSDLQIVYATTAEESLQDQIESYYRHRKIQRQDAEAFFCRLTEKVEGQIRSCPERPSCKEAASLGLHIYSEIYVDSYWFIFEFDKAAKLVMIAACFHERQSIIRQLECYLLSSRR